MRLAAGPRTSSRLLPTGRLRPPSVSKLSASRLPAAVLPRPRSRLPASHPASTPLPCHCQLPVRWTWTRPRPSGTRTRHGLSRTVTDCGASGELCYTFGFWGVRMQTTRSRSFYLLLLALLLPPSLLPALAWEREPLSVFHERRARLVRETGGDGVIVLFGYRDADLAASVTTFHQNENFYYLTSWNEPEAMMLLVPKAQKPGAASELEKEILFIPAHDFREEKWTGPKLGPDDAEASARTGFSLVRADSLFQSELLDALKTFPKIYTELTPQPESGEDYFQAEVVSKLRGMAPLATLEDVRPRVERQRVVKSPGEIALLRKAVEASVEGHFAAMKTVR